MAKVSKRTGNRRLLKLADMLIGDARNKKGIMFDLGVVGRYSNFGSVSEVVQLDCGTTACAMGLAAISGKFKRAGLSYWIGHEDNQILTTINGHYVEYTDAAIRIFGISQDAADYLFSPWKYPQNIQKGAGSERFVAKRIKQFVKDGIVQPAPF